MTVSRRHFLQTSAAFALGFSGLHTLFGFGRADVPNTRAISERFGPMRPDPNKSLDLPEGFSYQIRARAGERMTDGFFVPAAHDGMAAFPGPDGSTLFVNIQGDGLTLAVTGPWQG